MEQIKAFQIDKNIIYRGKKFKKKIQIFANFFAAPSPLF